MKLCSGCGRHVREDTCPFCGASGTVALSRARVRGSRTARILGVAALGVACGGTTAPGDAGSNDSGPADATEDFAPGPMYGAIMPDAGNDAADASDASDASDADATGIALYGAPPPLDGGS
jgi:hypothetical protein